MNLFNNEEYYMKAIHALWVLRALVVKDVEYTDTNGWLRYDEQALSIGFTDLLMS